MFIIVLYGTLRIGKNNTLTDLQIKNGEEIHYIRCSDMLGFQNLTELSGTFQEEKWKFDVYADTDATLAVLPFGEIKTEIRRQGPGMFKILELAANKAWEVTHYNIMGTSLYNSIKFNPQAVHMKKVREFFNKN